MLSAQNSKRKSSGKTTRRTFHLCLIIAPEHTHKTPLFSASICSQHFEHWCTENRLSYPVIWRKYLAMSLLWTDLLLLLSPVTRLQRKVRQKKHRLISLQKHGCSWLFFFFLSRCLVLHPLRQHVSKSLGIESGTWCMAYGVSKSREDAPLTAGTGHELISPLPGSSFAVPLVM